MVGDTAKGFAGLSAYRTDVDAAIAASDAIREAAAPAAAEPPSWRAAAPVQPVHRDGGALGGGLKKLLGWVGGIALVLVLKACIFSGVHAVSGSSSESAPAPVVQPLETASSADGTASEAADGSTATQPTDESGTVAPAEGADDGAALEEPEEGSTATLTLPQLRYCIAENIRMTAYKSEMDSVQATDVERFNRNLDGFNRAVNEYNGRCYSRSYLSRTKDEADAQIEARRSALEQEGAARVE